MINKIFLVSFFFFSLNISSNQFSDKEVRNIWLLPSDKVIKN